MSVSFFVDSVVSRSTSYSLCNCVFLNCGGITLNHAEGDDGILCDAYNYWGSKGIECCRFWYGMTFDLNDERWSDDNLKDHIHELKGCPYCTCEGKGYRVYEGVSYKEFLQLSNTNFCMFADMLGIQYNSNTMDGEIKGKQLDFVCKNAIKLLNNKTKVEDGLASTYSIDKGQAYRHGNEIRVSATIIDLGKDTDRWIENIKQLIETIKVARNENSFVIFG